MLTEAQTNELKRLKAYFPYRVVFGVIDKQSGEFSAWAKTTKHAMNSQARKGNKVYELSSK